MVEENHSYGIQVMKDSLIDENLSIQLDAIKRLHTLAASIGKERTCEELIPYLSDCVDIVGIEARFNIADEIPLMAAIVGKDQIGILLEILVKLCFEEDTLVGNNAVLAMKTITDQLNKEECEESYYPLIEKMMRGEFFNTKCYAGSLISICYAKTSPDKQTELRNHFRTLIQDESPLVRRSTAKSLVDLIPLIDEEAIKSEIVPIFDNLSDDEQDSVRSLAVDVGIAISKRLEDFEIYDFVLPSFKLLGEDISWRVRQKVVSSIHNVEITAPIRQEIFNIYQQCARDPQKEVRVVAAENMYKLSLSLLKGFTEDEKEDAHKFMDETVVPVVHSLWRDPSTDVKDALSTNIILMSSILPTECFNLNILPLIIDALENNECMPFKENMLKTLHLLPEHVDITKSLESIGDVFQNLISNSLTHWRTRRNLLVALVYITRNTTSEFFDKNLMPVYCELLNDTIFAIRRTAPLILPPLVKRFGTKWAEKSLVPFIKSFSDNEKFRYRYVTLFATEELIAPTLNWPEEVGYLDDLMNKSKHSLETLVKIKNLNNKLQGELGVCPDYAAERDDLNLYAEDTLDTLKEEYKVRIFDISSEEEECYLEGVLIMLIKDLIKVVKGLIEDPVENVQDRAKTTLKMIKVFNSNVKQELDRDWVQERLEEVNEDDLKKINEDIEWRLTKPESEDKEQMDCDLEDSDPEEKNDLGGTNAEEQSECDLEDLDPEEKSDLGGTNAEEQSECDSEDLDPEGKNDLGGTNAEEKSE